MTLRHPDGAAVVGSPANGIVDSTLPAWADEAGRQNQLRDSQDRSAFEPGKFITPHGAWFDHAGNIFVAEWVEIGRVTKLRKV